MHEELTDDGFEIVAVAQDSGGEEAAGPHYDRAGATFTTLLDPRHAVTALYGMVNVPSGVWIDEHGVIVRPPEVAYSRRYEFGAILAGDDRYAQGWSDGFRQCENEEETAERQARMAIEVQNMQDHHKDRIGHEFLKGIDTSALKSLK